MRRSPACCFACLAISLASSGTARAADLPDPTRPPTAQRKAVAAVASASGSAIVKPSGPVLQSILTGVGRKPSVIISGHLLALGESFDNMRLMRVSETTAWLSGPHGQTALMLTPGADKIAATSTDNRIAVRNTKPTDARRVGIAPTAVQLAEQK